MRLQAALRLQQWQTHAGTKVYGSTRRPAATLPLSTPPQRSYGSLSSPPPPPPTSGSPSTPSFPQQEAATVKRLQELLSGIRRRHPGMRGALPKRFSNVTWNEFLHSQEEAKQKRRGERSSAGGEGGGGIDDAQDFKAATIKKIDAMMAKSKRMHNSYVELHLPFANDEALLEQYIATSGKIRMGKIFEDLDTLAGDIAYQHVLGGRPRTGPSGGGTPVFIVTASVDRLDLVVDHLRSDRDYRLSGLPIFVGSSSMEVLVVIDELIPGRDPNDVPTHRTCLMGRFTMVAKNGLTQRAQRIPSLELREQDEEQLFAFGKSHKDRKQSEEQLSLSKVPPKGTEARWLHEQWLSDQNHSSLQDGSVRADQGIVVPSNQTRMVSTEHIHPQSANIHLRLFGGYVMRGAFELAWMVAASFVQRHVRFLALDSLSFHSPVPIGALLSMTAQIDYTQETQGLQEADSSAKTTVAAVSVVVETLDFETGQKRRTNTFHFSFELGDNPEGKRVSPQTYLEAMNWIEGKRRMHLGLELRKLYSDARQLEDAAAS